MKYNKGFAPLAGLLIVLGIIVVGGVLYFTGKSSTLKNEVTDNSNYLPTTNTNSPAQAPLSTNISITLPEYVHISGDCGGPSVCWPPIITTSSTSYSCVPHINKGDVTDDVVEKVINDKTYCISRFGDSYAGGAGWKYTYTTSNSNSKGTKIATFGFLYSSCGVWQGDGTTKYSDCQATQSTFSANLDNLIDSSM